MLVPYCVNGSFTGSYVFNKTAEKSSLAIDHPERFRLGNYVAAVDRSELRWTADEPEEFEVVEKVFEYFHPRRDFAWLEVRFLRNQQE